MVVHSDTIQVKLDGQGHGSKFTVTGGNVAAVIGVKSSEGFLVARFTRLFAVKNKICSILQPFTGR